MNFNKGKSSHLVYRLYNFVAFVVVFFVLYLLLPKESRFRYEFQKGKPWLHETMYAPFDFAIDKSQESIVYQQDSVLRNFAPIFIVADSIKTNALTNLEEDIRKICENSIPSIDSKSIDSLTNILRKPLTDIYTAGILSRDISSYDELKNHAQVKIIKDKFIKDFPTSSLYSLKSGYSYVVKEWQQNVSISAPSFLPFLSGLSARQYIDVNLHYDKETSLISYNELLDQVSLTKGMVQIGERIISQGEVVDSQVNLILKSLKTNYELRINDNSLLYIAGGRALFLVICLLVLFFYSFVIFRDLLRSKRSINLLFSLFIGIVALSRVVSDFPALHLYMVPVPLMPILVHTFIDKRVAIFSNTVLAMVIGYFAPNAYDFVLIQFVAGTIAVVSLGKMQRRGHLIVTSLYVFISYLVTYIAISVVQEGDFTSIDWTVLRWFAIASVLLMLVYPLGWICEKFFGFVSDITLIELSDTNQPLLRRLSQEAPGTFQHSIQVANIAEQIVMEIGGNPHLVRAGALYHDIGKISNSVYFTENQAGQSNPHNQFSNEESAKVIINHVDSGVQLAKKQNLPDAIVDFIRTHHGTTKTGYFYAMSLKENSGNVDAKTFTYPGPAPYSKETAVVMLTDGIEAASRSLPEKTKETLSNLIDKIVDGKMKEGQLNYAPITLLDITKIKAIFLDKLSNVYHVRIAYPEPTSPKE